MLTKSVTEFDVELKITMRDEKDPPDGGVVVYGFHSGSELRRTVNSVVMNTFDVMDEMFGNRHPSPWRNPKIKTELKQLKPRVVGNEFDELHASVAPELLADEVTYIDGT